VLDERKICLFLNGVKLDQNLSNGIYRIYSNSGFIGLGVVENRQLKRDVVIEK